MYYVLTMQASTGKWFDKRGIVRNIIMFQNAAVDILSSTH